MAEPNEKSALQRIAEILVAHGVEFLVVGGQAETLFGSPRVTYDTDLCYRRTADNLRSLFQLKAIKQIREKGQG